MIKQEYALIGRFIQLSRNIVMSNATRHIRLIVAAAIALFLGVSVAQSDKPSAEPTVEYNGGFRIDNMSYELDPAFPTRLAAIRFRFRPLTPTAAQFIIRVKVVRSSATYVACRSEEFASDRWICPLGGIQVQSADQFDINVQTALPPGYRLYIPIILR